MQPYPHPSDASDKIWSRLATWLQRYSSLKVWTTDHEDRRLRTDKPLVYYKLTLWAFGSGELKILTWSLDIWKTWMLYVPGGLRLCGHKKKKFSKHFLPTFLGDKMFLCNVVIKHDIPIHLHLPGPSGDHLCSFVPCIETLHNKEIKQWN